MTFKPVSVMVTSSTGTRRQDVACVLNQGPWRRTLGAVACQWTSAVIHAIRRQLSLVDVVVVDDGGGVVRWPEVCCIMLCWAIEGEREWTGRTTQAALCRDFCSGDGGGWLHRRLNGHPLRVQLPWLLLCLALPGNKGGAQLGGRRSSRLHRENVPDVGDLQDC